MKAADSGRKSLWAKLKAIIFNGFFSSTTILIEKKKGNAVNLVDQT